MSARDELRQSLGVSLDDLRVVNDFLTSPDNPLVDALLDVVERHGGVDEINRKADEAGRLDNRLERLRGDREGQHSIRVNDRYRICFRWEEGDATDVEVTDYH